ncbi:phosphoenolpyruvate-protein phosphotransferase [Paenibacillus sp. CCS19]|uniref:phosphoenolpyruvate--protein phosphotransferase n=1 Tax=Paenibacillus sp. CCS19 TaxID=3158387 RepID=UPI002566E019|nr:phosphoenolpyruvate--protein phosphotransferase [Paenibacillus cellulosilyticus]GMK37698.1 phosphoenolpyruvate-protein phosphotransferase [Paenibacillus cellulosilyticus]
MSKALQGTPASSGIAIGYAKVLRTNIAAPAASKIDPAMAEAEAARFDAAVSTAAEELEAIRTKLLGDGKEHEAEIFEAHAFLLEDEELVGAAREKITAELFDGISAILETAKEVSEVLGALDDPYLRERSADVLDVGRRIARLLSGEQAVDAAGGDSLDGVGALDARAIIIAEDLTPSETAGLDASTVAGFATAVGGATSHSAIIARSGGFPAVVGIGEGLMDIQNGQLVIVDGGAGLVLIEPDAAMLAEYETRRLAAGGRQVEYDMFRDRPSMSADGVQVELVANIGSSADAKEAQRKGAEGIGLFRTEFLFMGRDTLPTEDEQYEAYRTAAEAFGADAPIVIRTMDIGGDKELPLLELEKEDNPFLGYRAIRISLDRPELFKTQLRAILRASAHGNVKAMFPMIATLKEWRMAKQLLEEAKQELSAKEVPFNPNMETGIMIEIPAAAMMADRLAREVDFFSIGTNDLVQYTMAADRMNPKLSTLSDPFAPAVMRLIDRVITAAHAEGRWVGMCGEMAGHPLALPVLLGMGLDEFSMSAGSVTRARWLLARLDRERLQSLARAVLDVDDADEAKALVLNEVPELREIV